MSTIKADNIATLAGVSTSMANAVNGSAKAWVNFNGSGTVAIRRSFNVSSITDLGTGRYRVNFTNAMADANYSVSFQQSTGSAQITGGGTTPQIQTVHSQVAASFDIQVGYYTGTSNTIADNDNPATWASVAIFS